jgi:hypothetical protein
VAAALRAKYDPATLRFIGYGDIYTDDLLRLRINVLSNRDSIVTGVRLG